MDYFTKFNSFSIQFLSMKLTAASTFYDFNSESDAVETMQVYALNFFFFYKKIQARINSFIYDVNFFLNFNSLISFYLMVDVLASLNATSTFSIYHWIAWNQWFTFCAEILIWNKIFLICFISFTNVWMSQICRKQRHIRQKRWRDWWKKETLLVRLLLLSWQLQGPCDTILVLDVITPLL